jgi:hypothetical protein
MPFSPCLELCASHVAWLRCCTHCCTFVRQVDDNVLSAVGTALQRLDLSDCVLLTSMAISVRSCLVTFCRFGVLRLGCCMLGITCCILGLARCNGAHRVQAVVQRCPKLTALGLGGLPSLVDQTVIDVSRLDELSSPPERCGVRQRPNGGRADGRVPVRARIRQ